MGYFKEKGQWAVLLGGSFGLGWASACKLASQGMHLCIVHRDRRADLDNWELRLDELRNTYDVRIISFNVDAMQATQRQSVIQKLMGSLKAGEQVRLLLHSIAKGNLRPLMGPDRLEQGDFALTAESMAWSLWDWFTGLYETGRMDSRARVIAFTSSGSRKPLKGYAAVSAAKAGLEALVRSMALEYGHTGMRFNCIQAGMTDTRAARLIPGFEAMATLLKERHPALRMTTPEDVADVVYLLCLPEADWINGAVIPADGGESLVF